MSQPASGSRENSPDAQPNKIWPATLWDAKTAKPIHAFKPHRFEVTAVAFAPNDELVFTGDAKGNGRLWDAKTYAQIGTATAAHSRGITAAVFLPDGNGLLTASNDNTVALWDIARGTEGPALLPRKPRDHSDGVRLRHPDAVLSMAVSPDGLSVATACADKIVRIWDVQRGVETRQLAAAWGATSVAISPDGRRLVTTRFDSSVHLWDWSTRQEIGVVGGHTAAFQFHTQPYRAWSSCFTPDGTRVLTVGGGDAILWDVEDPRHTVRFNRQGAVASANFSPDGSRVVTANWDNTARIWDVQTGRVERKLAGHEASINQAVFSPDGTKVLTASDDKTAAIWDARSGDNLREFKGHRESVRGIAFSHNGKRVVTASTDKTARIWDADNGQPIRSPGSGQTPIELKHDQAVLCAAFSPDDACIITGGEDNCVRRWDANTGAPLPFDRDDRKATLVGHSAAVASLAFSPDGKRIVTGSRDGTAKVWEFQSGRELLTLKGHTQEVTTVVFSPDQKTVMTGSLDGTAILWFAVEWQKGKPADSSSDSVLRRATRSVDDGRASPP